MLIQTASLKAWGVWAALFQRVDTSFGGFPLTRLLMGTGSLIGSLPCVGNELDLFVGGLRLRWLTAVIRMLFRYRKIRVTLMGRESLRTCFVFYIFRGKRRSLWRLRGLLTLSTLVGATFGIALSLCRSSLLVTTAAYESKLLRFVLSDDGAICLFLALLRRLVGVTGRFLGAWLCITVAFSGERVHTARLSYFQGGGTRGRAGASWDYRGLIPERISQRAGQCASAHRWYLHLLYRANLYLYISADSLALGVGTGGITGQESRLVLLEGSVSVVWHLEFLRLL